MKVKFFLMMSAAALLASLTSCSEEELGSSINVLEVDPSELSFGPKSEEAVISVTTDASYWNFSADGWIKATKGEDGTSLIVTVSDNPEYEERTGKILFTAGNANSVRVDVSQEARIVSSLELSSEAVSFGPEGGSAEITVTSAEEWTVSGSSEWCTLSTSEGVSGDVITVTAQANDTEETRTAMFRVTSGTVTKTLTVTATPVPFIELVSPEADQQFDCAGYRFNIVLRTNLDADAISMSVTGNEDGWLSVTSQDGTTYSVSVAENTSYKARSASISFSAEGVDPVAVNVVQYKKPYLEVVEPQSMSFDLGTDAEDVSVVIRTNLTKELSLYVSDWISQKGEPQLVENADGLTDCSYTFTVSAASGSRAGEITFWYEQTEASIRVEQTGDDAVFVTIPDAAFRESLLFHGYIMSADSEEVQLTAEGLNATMLDCQYDTRIESIQGIEAFTNLTTITLSNLNRLRVVDISGLTKVSSLTMGNCGYTEEIILGDNPITDFSYGWYTSVYADVTISSSCVENLNVSDPQGFSDEWHVLDVTGCTALKTINSQRFNSLTIYVTADQKDSIVNTGNGVLTVK